MHMVLHLGVRQDNLSDFTCLLVSLPLTINKAQLGIIPNHKAVLPSGWQVALLRSEFTQLWHLGALISHIRHINASFVIPFLLLQEFSRSPTT